MQTLVSIGAVGASPQIGEILPLRDFTDCPYLFFSPSCAQVKLLYAYKCILTCYSAGKCLKIFIGDKILCPQSDQFSCKNCCGEFSEHFGVHQPL